MKMKRSEMLGLFQRLHNVNMQGRKVAYAIAKNINKITPHVRAMNEADKADSAFREYEEERMALIEKFAERDADGKKAEAKDEQGNVTGYKLGKNAEKFQKGFAELMEKHRDAIDAHDAFYNETEEVDLHMIKEEDLPEDVDVSELRKIAVLLAE